MNSIKQVRVCLEEIADVVNKFRDEVIEEFKFAPSAEHYCEIQHRGIGINFDSDISIFPEDTKERASSLFDAGKATITKNMLIAKIIEKISNCQP